MGKNFITLWRKENSYKILVGMPEEKTPIRRHKPKSHDDVCWIELAKTGGKGGLF